MKASAVVQLQQLRQLRERRAQLQLASQVQRCLAASAALQQAQGLVDEAQGQLQREAEALQQLLGKGALPVGTYQAALEVLQAFDEHRLYLAQQLLSADHTCAAEQEQKATLQRALLLRQQQCEALTPVLAECAREAQRVEQSIEEELYDERAAQHPGVAQ